MEHAINHPLVCQGYFYMAVSWDVNFYFTATTRYNSRNGTSCAVAVWKYWDCKVVANKN